MAGNVIRISVVMGGMSCIQPTFDLEQPLVNYLWIKVFLFLMETTINCTNTHKKKGHTRQKKKSVVFFITVLFSGGSGVGFIPAVMFWWTGHLKSQFCFLAFDDWLDSRAVVRDGRRGAGMVEGDTHTQRRWQ